ncbi:MAG: PAQR family membrane homeostasis protein TrhA [Shimia sp.]
MAYLVSRSELVADGAVHLTALAASVAATVWLILAAAQHGGGADVAAVCIYGAATIACFTASSLYNLTPWEGARPVLHRLDHAAIYLKIAGTYTPLVVILGSALGYAMLGAIWAVALVAALGKMTARLRMGLASTLLYLAMGWASVVLIWPLAHALPAAATALMVAGGLTYSVGAIFNHWEGLRFHRAIWHVFVLAGTGCFAAAILQGLWSLPA